jgi:hypothetical protein
MGKTTRKTFEEVKRVFEEAGYRLLSTEYINSKTKLECVCTKGHEKKTTYADFRSGRRCIECYHQKQREERLTPIEEIRQVFSSRGYQLLTDHHSHGRQIFEALCPRGHLYKTNLTRFKDCGYGCSKCAAINNSGTNNPNWNPDREAVKQNGKIWRAWRNCLRGGVSGRNKKTSDEIKAILGYDWNDLKTYILNHPNWEKLSDKISYHVDHVFPVKAFLDYGIKDPKIICALENLQPLDKGVNMKKNRHYDKQEFEAYLRSKGLLK